MISDITARLEAKDKDINARLNQLEEQILSTAVRVVVKVMCTMKKY